MLTRRHSITGQGVRAAGLFPLPAGFSPRNPPFFRIALVLAVLAAVLVLTDGALAPQASAQGPPTWDEDGDLTVQIPGTVETFAGKCARWPAGSPYTLEYLNASVEIYAICGSASSVYRSYYEDNCDEDGDNCTEHPAGYYGTSTARVYVGPSTDLDRFTVLSPLGIRWPDRSSILYSGFTLSGTPTESTDISDQSTLRLSRSIAHRARSSRTPESSRYTNLALGTATSVEFSISSTILTTGGTPDTPTTLSAARNSGYDSVDVTWELFDEVSEYEIERLTAVSVTAGDAGRVEYGNLVRFSIEGTISGVDSYTDDTVETNQTYQYRMRARGGVDEWSPWSPYVFSGAKPDVEVDAPANVTVSREYDNSSITVTWSPPDGQFDNYTLQRQELVTVEGSTFFANAVTLDGDTWLPGDTTTFTDRSILPGRTYEYRVAVVVNDVVGEYTDWSRSSRVQASLGGAPANLRFVEDGSRLLADRREFWMAWDTVDGADDYEVDVLVDELATGRQSMENYLVTDPTFFRTAFGTVHVRTRARKYDDDLCGGDSDRCFSEWTSWYRVRFTPKVSIEAPPMLDGTGDASIMEMRENTEEALEFSLGAAGSPVDGGLVIQFLTVTVASILGVISVVLAWRRGMAPLGVGMGIAIMILVLFAGNRLFGVPAAWPVGFQSVVGVAGVFAMVRQTGVFR